MEIERARLTKRLASMVEAEGKVDEAADILQEVPVVSRTGVRRAAWGRGGKRGSRRPHHAALTANTEWAGIS